MCELWSTLLILTDISVLFSKNFVINTFIQVYFYVEQFCWATFRSEVSYSTHLLHLMLLCRKCLNNQLGQIRIYLTSNIIITTVNKNIKNIYFKRITIKSKVWNKPHQNKPQPSEKNKLLCLLAFWEWYYKVHCSEEQCGIVPRSAGEERPADSESSRGQAVDDNQRPAEGAGWAEDRAGSHAAPDEPDLSESEESDWTQPQGKNPTRPQYHESEKTMISE